MSPDGEGQDSAADGPWFRSRCCSCKMGKRGPDEQERKDWKAVKWERWKGGRCESHRRLRQCTCMPKRRRSDSLHAALVHLPRGRCQLEGYFYNFNFAMNLLATSIQASAMDWASAMWDTMS